MTQNSEKFLTKQLALRKRQQKERPSSKTKLCLVCGVAFKYGGYKICSDKCRLAHKREQNKTIYKKTRRKYQKKWRNKNGIAYDKKWRDMNKKAITKRQHLKRYGKTFKTSPRTAAKRLGFKSMFEVQVAELLKAKKVPVLYETKTFRYIPTQTVRKYTPDFELRDNIFLEAKGYLSAQNRAKYIDIKKQHPEIDLCFVFEKATNKINKKSKTTYSAWCQKNGFKWCEFPNIPVQWLK